jgi:transcriptional regulator
MDHRGPSKRRALETFPMTDGSSHGAHAYPPAAFRETRRDVLIDFIRRTVFGHLISSGPEGPLAGGAPFVLREGAEGVVLEAHLARANPQTNNHNAPALVLFQGPDAYVRPGWYPSKARDGKAVPTWDYISVQARGRLEVLDEPSWLRGHLDAISGQQESPFADPWSPADPPPGYVDALSRGIVGVRVVVASLEGVWKLSQNHPAENRLGVIQGLGALEDHGSRAIARAIAERETM